MFASLTIAMDFLGLAVHSTLSGACLYIRRRALGPAGHSCLTYLLSNSPWGLPEFCYLRQQNTPDIITALIIYKKSNKRHLPPAYLDSSAHFYEIVPCPHLKPLTLLTQPVVHPLLLSVQIVRTSNPTINYVTPAGTCGELLILLIFCGKALKPIETRLARCSTKLYLVLYVNILRIMCYAVKLTRWSAPVTNIGWATPGLLVCC